MPGISHILLWAAWAIVAAAAAYLIVAAASVVAHRAARGPGWASLPRVTVLKPLCGVEDGLEAALRSFLSQQADAHLHYVFGVADPADPALALSRRVAADYPGCRVDFIVDPRTHGANPKVGNLINMAAVGLGEVVVMSDDDIIAPPGSLQALIDGLAAPGVGAVTSLYRARPGPAAGAIGRLGALFIDGWFLPMAVLHARLAPLAVTYGPLTAIRRDVLERAGGLAALADNLSDDAELGHLVRAQGRTIAFAPMVVETLANDRSLSDLFSHELRWARTVRGLDPVGYLASVITHSGPIPLLLALFSPGLASFGALLGLIGLRWMLVSLTARRFGRSFAPPGPLTLWARDQLCFAVWLAGCVVKRVEWRGRRLTVGSGALLESGARTRPVA